MREQALTSFTTKHHFRIGLWLAFGGTVLFAVKSIFIKLAYAQGVDTVTLLTLRMLVAAPFYLGVLLWLFYKTPLTPPVHSDLGMMIGLGFIGYYFSSFLDMQGLNYISAQLERLMLYTYPIMTTLLGWLVFREVITKRIMLALLFTYSGVLLLYAHEAKLSGAHVSLGAVLVGIAAFSFAFYVVFSKRVIGRVGSTLFTSIAMLAATGFVFIHFLVTHPVSALWVNANAWFYAILLGFFSTVLPSFMLSEAIGRIGSARASIMGTAGPIITILLAVMFLNEPFGWTHLLGMALVIGGVSLLGKK
ncbi:DMT family transporter [Thiolinea disciformis]|uniref:DMT family transporter n=1 Tax=Thiolinea disciformis TaxID=125614 RepID=UPI00036959DD|nr:DMT family transporter [Thiolinea disciformis]